MHMSAMTTSKLSQRTVTAMSSGYLANELNGLVLPASNRKRAKWARSEICIIIFIFFFFSAHAGPSAKAEFRQKRRK